MDTHIADRKFGMEALKDPRPSPLDVVLQTSEVTLPSIPAHIVALECYDELFDIYANSSRANSPLALIGMHESEDLAIVDTYDVYLERYMAANVLKFTGITYDKFLLLTKDRAESILQRCDRMSGSEDTAVENLMNSATSGKKK